MQLNAKTDTSGLRLAEFELNDLDADQRLLAWPGVSLLVFTSAGCGACRYARQVLAGWPLPVDRLCWIDAQHSGGLVQRYEVFQLPALFVVRDGQLGALAPVALRVDDLVTELKVSLAGPLEELP